jgi:RNA polymerase sigma-70 factor (ECF subfamily)
MGLAMRVIGDRAVAEDLVQEVFIRAWRTAPRFRAMGAGRSGAGAWLSRVTLNLAIDHARRPRSLPLEAAGDPLDPAPGADEEMIAAERRQRLYRAIAALPARQRAAIALAYDEGLSNAEGAFALDVSVGAFELLLVRARRSLREAFAPTVRD